MAMFIKFEKKKILLFVGISNIHAFYEELFKF